LNNVNEIDNLNIDKISHFIVGDTKNEENPLILSSPQKTNSLVKVLLEEMQTFVQPRNIYGKLEFSSWGQEEICSKNDTDLCPSVVIQGTTNFPYRYLANEVISLDNYFEKHMMTNNIIFSTKFIKQAEYDYSIDGKYVAIPLITDIRIMYFNRTTYDRFGLRYPPPYGNRSSWTWLEMVEDVRTINENLKKNNIREKVFDFNGLYDEEMKLLSVILRNYGVPTISSFQRCGLCEVNGVSDMKNKTRVAIEEVIKPLFSIYNENSKSWCDGDWSNGNKEIIDKDYTKLDKIECGMEEPTSTYGLIFGSPPSMSKVNVITSKEMMNKKEYDSYELAVALVPGSFTCKNYLY